MTKRLVKVKTDFLIMQEYFNFVHPEARLRGQKTFI